MINFIQTHESGVMRTTGNPHSESHRSTQQWRRLRGLIAPAVTDPNSLLLPSYYPDVAEVRADLTRHYDNIHAMDRQVGRILNELKQDGLMDNTVVIWTTDHGDGLPRAKRELYDSGLKVPMVVLLPASVQASFSGEFSTPGTINQKLISFVDLAPTLLSLAGAPAQQYHHGINFLTESRRFVYASRDRIDEVPDRQRAVRNHRYKYIHSWHPQTPGGHELVYRDNLDMVRTMRAMYENGELDAIQSRWFEAPGREQLYDLLGDPEEVVNLAGSPDHAATKSELSAELHAWLARVGDMSNVPEKEMRNTFLIEGEIPTTPAPTAREINGHIELRATMNASIGYRVDGGIWQLYTRPVTRGAGTLLESKAVRYGYRESALLSLSLVSDD